MAGGATAHGVIVDVGAIVALAVEVVAALGVGVRSTGGEVQGSKHLLLVALYIRRR